MDSGFVNQSIAPFTPYEWLYVRQLFRSRIPNDVKECLTMLSTWITRTGENTPVAIHCSQVLLQAVYADIQMQGMCQSEWYRAIDDLRAKHGYAIVRFVNYLNELGQTRSVIMNMARAVGQFGLAKKIVDIRHAITHQTCPDIAELRRATHDCLDWLWENFWFKDSRVAMNSSNAKSANKNGPQSEFNSQRNTEQLYVKSLREFSTWRLKNRQLNTELEFSEVPEIYVIKQHILLDAIGFLRCFVRDSNFIQTEAQWKNWNFAPTSSADTWNVPNDFQEFWSPVVHLMFGLKLGADIVIAFLWRLKESNIKQISKNQITAYVRQFITQFGDSEMFSPEEWTRILDHLLPVAKHFNKDIIDIAMRNCPNLSRKRRNQIHKILNIATPVTTPVGTPIRPSTSIATSSASPRGQEVRTVDDLQALLSLQRSKRSASEASTTSRNEGTGIELCDSMDWIDVPFGMAPGQRIETFTVVIENSDSERRKRKAFDAVITLENDD